jgi:hypothetical protein
MNPATVQRQAAKPSRTYTYLMLISRLVLFLLFQALVAVVLQSWEASEAYWLLTATLTNIVSITLLFLLFRREGRSFRNLFSFNREAMRKDIYIFVGLLILTVPVALVPGYLLGNLLWNDPQVPATMLFRPIEPGLIYGLLIAFPVTIVFAELATYFGYVMPNLKKLHRSKWIALILPVIFLSIQHCTLPFVPDLNFIVYRGLVFLPFAILIGVSLYLRPSLFIYFAILHGVLDLGTVLMYLLEL